MKKTQVYLPADQLAALHALARRTKRSVAELIREAIRTTWLQPAAKARGPVALWDGRITLGSDDHDTIYDAP